MATLLPRTGMERYDEWEAMGKAENRLFDATTRLVQAR